MKIGNLIALLIVAAGMTCSVPAQPPHAATAKQKTTAAETNPAIDLSKVPLQEGIHEAHRDAKSGLRIFRVVNDGKEIDYFAVDRKGEVLTQNILPHCGDQTICYPGGKVCLLKHGPACTQ